LREEAGSPPGPGRRDGPEIAVLDALELELRQLSGVTFVAFGERGAGLVVGLGVERSADVAELRVEALRLSNSHLDGPVAIDLLDAAVPTGGLRSDQRVRLLSTVARAADDGVDVHLAFRERSVVVTAAATDRLEVANAVIRGLRQLGLPVPFEAVGAHGLADEIGSGTLVVLREPRTAMARRGLATGRTVAESTARAVLDGLNRFLQP
jgi:hypothetical protein